MIYACRMEAPLETRLSDCCWLFFFKKDYITLLQKPLTPRISHHSVSFIVSLIPHNMAEIQGSGLPSSYPEVCQVIVFAGALY